MMNCFVEEMFYEKYSGWYLIHSNNNVGEEIYLGSTWLDAKDDFDREHPNRMCGLLIYGCIPLNESGVPQIVSFSSIQNMVRILPEKKEDVHNIIINCLKADCKEFDEYVELLKEFDAYNGYVTKIII